MLTARIFERARRTPAKLAIIDGHARLSYEDFARVIEAARRHLASLTLPVGQVAVLCMASLLEVWIVGLALRSLGVTTLAVRAFEDIANLDLSEPACIVTTQPEATAAVLAMAAATKWRLIVLAPGVFSLGPDALAPPQESTAPARGGHILLTSGTTGAYKKVLIDPASELANIPRRAAMFGVSERSLVNLFDFGGWTSAGYNMAVCAWGVGGAVAMNQGPGKYRSAPWAETTHAELHTEMLRDLLDGADAIAPNPAMALIVISGSLSRALWEKAKARLTPRIFTCVAATETGPFAVTSVETADDLHWHRVHPSRRVEIVDEADQPVPPGVQGRLRVHFSDNVRGYLDDPAATAHFFRDGCFYPGDLAVFGPDGRLALQGRVTEVINVMGAKVAAPPIEDALRDQLGAQGVCLFSLQGADGGEELHIAIESRRPIDPQALSTAIRRQLHGFDGAHVHFVPTLPRSPAGKVQRLAVRAMIMGGAGAQAPVEP